MENKSKNNSGFTIVELLVAMSLFMVVTAIVAGVFIRSLRTQRISMALVSANNNAELSVEQMAREIRTGFDFLVSGDGRIINFTSKGKEISYKIEGGSLQRSVNGGIYSKITADDVTVYDTSKFIRLEDALFPERITIIMRVGSPKAFDAEESLIDIQTTVSSRIL
ncbi:MAG: prepilin-type N-terminal cleavage/methylation domain-containing protein [Candidatus Pacebacteria bacterium]|nr:prepilin-type N-terminal cleavage/methylation domain-containing protein [Candidatus Paceibacterota bacterium]